jgi:hypothetical protein
MQLVETPQSPRKPRRDGWTPARRAQFLGHLAAGLDVKRACALVGLSRQKAYALRGRDAAFAAAWDKARRAARAAADEAFLALLPEKLRRTMSDLSAACHLPRAQVGVAGSAQVAEGDSEQGPADFDPRTVSVLSGTCHLRGTALLPLDPVPSVPSVSPSPRGGAFR